MENIEHPDITTAHRTGYPSGTKEVVPICPICGEECDEIYSDKRTGEIFGCDNCVTERDALEVAECFAGEE